jgi:hypothetical protein
MVELVTRMLDLKKQQSRAQGIRSSFIVDSFIVERPNQERICRVTSSWRLKGEKDETSLVGN